MTSLRSARLTLMRSGSTPSRRPMPRRWPSSACFLPSKWAQLPKRLQSWRLPGRGAAASRPSHELKHQLRPSPPRLPSQDEAALARRLPRNRPPRMPRPAPRPSPGPGRRRPRVTTRQKLLHRSHGPGPAPSQPSMRHPRRVPRRESGSGSGALGPRLRNSPGMQRGRLAGRPLAEMSWMRWGSTPPRRWWWALGFACAWPSAA
jgi:hypothetical protein